MKFTMTQEEYEEYGNLMYGLCISCGAERDSCEPDVQEYECEECGKRKVYGVPELLMMGMIEFSGDSDE